MGAGGGRALLGTDEESARWTEEEPVLPVLGTAEIEARLRAAGGALAGEAGVLLAKSVWLERRWPAAAGALSGDDVGVFTAGAFGADEGRAYRLREWAGRELPALRDGVKDAVAAAVAALGWQVGSCGRGCCTCRPPPGMSRRSGGARRGSVPGTWSLTATSVTRTPGPGPRMRFGGDGGGPGPARSRHHPAAGPLPERGLHGLPGKGEQAAVQVPEPPSGAAGRSPRTGWSRCDAWRERCGSG